MRVLPPLEGWQVRAMVAWLARRYRRAFRHDVALQYTVLRRRQTIRGACAMMVATTQVGRWLLDT